MMRNGICLFLLLLLCLYAPHEAYALSISARIADQSTEVSGGDRLYFEVEIKYPENPVRKDLRIEYQIAEHITTKEHDTSEHREILASEKVLRAVETQASFLDYIIVPKSVKGGLHDLHVIVTDYEGLHKEVSASFKVLKGVDQLTTYFILLLCAVLLVGVLVVFQIRPSRRTENM